MQRQLVIKPLVDALFVYLKKMEPTVPSSGQLRKAYTYILNQEKYLRVFLEDGEVPIDNNASERAIRGVFCKHFLEKNAKYFWRMLHLQIGESCKALTGSCSASHKPLQIIFSCYSTRYGNGSSEFSSSCACSLK